MSLSVPFEASSAFRFSRDHHNDSGGGGRRDRSYSDAHAILFSKTSISNDADDDDDAGNVGIAMPGAEASKMKQLVVAGGGKKLQASSAPQHQHSQHHHGRPRSKSLDVHRHHVAAATHKKKSHHQLHHMLSRMQQQQQHPTTTTTHVHGAHVVFPHGRHSPENLSASNMKLKGKMWIRPASPIRFISKDLQQQQPQYLFHEDVKEEDIVRADQTHDVRTDDIDILSSSPPIIYRSHYHVKNTAAASFDDEMELLYTAPTTTAAAAVLPEISFSSSSSSSTRTSPSSSYGESGKLIKPREFHLISTMRT